MDPSIKGSSPKVKPKWRGVSHQWSAVVSGLAAMILVLLAPTTRACWSAAIYGVSVTGLFAISALYHRIHWAEHQRRWWRRLDHSAIFLLIAGTYTPVVLMVFPKGAEELFLGLVWGGAILGILQSMFWPGAPKTLFAMLCVALGWVMVLEWDLLRSGLSDGQFVLIAAGGVLYTVGAVIYAIRRPDPWPEVFGYHEVFHGLTIVAAGCHAVVVTQLVLGP